MTLLHHQVGAAGPPQLLEILGAYDDQYNRVDGRWRIRESISSFFVPPI